MEELAFKSDPTLSFSQLFLLVLFISGLLLLSYCLRKWRGRGTGWLVNNQAKQARTSIQIIDRDTRLYRIEDDSHRFVIVRSGNAMLLLDKQALSKGDEL